MANAKHFSSEKRHTMSYQNLRSGSSRIVSTGCASNREYHTNFVVLDWGISSLIKTIALKRSKYFPGCSGSKALLASCLAYQVKLDPKHAYLVESYYARSLEQLRMELSDPIRVDKDGAVYAGLLLCFVSVCAQQVSAPSTKADIRQMELRLPWTIHLNGIGSIAKERNAFHYPDGSLKPHVFCLGIVDLPTHILGRKTDNLNIWYNYCRFQGGLEDCLGLPCSLVDLLSAIAEPDIVRHLLSWPNIEGTAEDRVIWDLTRHAGVIMASIYHSDNAKSCTTVNVEVDTSSTKRSVRHIVEIVRTLRASDMDFTSNTWSTLFFPLVSAGSQPQELEITDRTLILECISDLSNQSMNSDVTRQTTVPVLRELWDNSRGRSIQQVAQDLDLEIGLF